MCPIRWNYCWSKVEWALFLINYNCSFLFCLCVELDLKNILVLKMKFHINRMPFPDNWKGFHLSYQPKTVEQVMKGMDLVIGISIGILLQHQHQYENIRNYIG